MNIDNLPNDQEEVAIEFEKGAKAKAKWVAKKEGASSTCFISTEATPSISAMVRDTRRIR